MVITKLWIKQAKENQEEGTDVVLICKKSRMEPVVVMDAERFFEIIQPYLREKSIELESREGGKARWSRSIKKKRCCKRQFSETGDNTF